MNVFLRMAILATLLASALACAGPLMPHEPDVIDVTLPAPADRVTAAVVQVLTDGGYDVDRTDDQQVALHAKLVRGQAQSLVDRGAHEAGSLVGRFPNDQRGRASRDGQRQDRLRRGTWAGEGR